MSQRKENLYADVKLPSVGIVSSSSKDFFGNLDEQTYDNTDLIFVGNKETKNNEPKLFNEAINTYCENYDVLGFLSSSYNIVKNDAIDIIVRELDKSGYIVGTYSDEYIYDNEETKCYKAYPSYSISLMNSSVIINCPVFVKTTILKDQRIRFDENLSLLYYWDFMLKLIGMCFLKHVAKPLFSRKLEQIIEVQKDISIINEKDYSHSSDK